MPETMIALVEVIRLKLSNPILSGPCDSLIYKLISPFFLYKVYSIF